MTRPALVALFLGSLLASLALQLLLLPSGVATFAPLWVAMTIAYWALFGPNYPVLPVAFVLGLACDVAAAAPLGQHALGLVLMAYACISLRVTLGRFVLVQQALALLPLFLLYSLLLFWLDGMARHPSAPLARFLPAFSSALLWPLLCLLMDAIGGRDER